MDGTIRNPYVDVPGYDCFGCSPRNEHGLHMQFERDGNDVVSRWQPETHFQGFVGVLHGGVQATLMDEIASWLVFVQLDTAGVTAGMSIRFLKPVLLENCPVTVRAHLDRRDGRSAFIHVRIIDSRDVLCSTGECEYVLYSPEMARKRLNYPGADAFSGESHG